MWPAIYHLNERSIKDPGMIFPGQELVIQNTLSKEEIEKARREAFSGKLEE